MIINIEGFLKNPGEEWDSEKKLSDKLGEDRDEYLTFMYCCLMAASDAQIEDHMSFETYENIAYDVIDNITNRFGESVAKDFTKEFCIRRIDSWLKNPKKTEADRKPEEPPKGGLN